MGLFNRSQEAKDAAADYRTANAAQQDYARTSGNRDENDPTYLALNGATNGALSRLRAARRSQ